MCSEARISSEKEDKVTATNENDRSTAAQMSKSRVVTRKGGLLSRNTHSFAISTWKPKQSWQANVSLQGLGRKQEETSCQNLSRSL